MRAAPTGSRSVRGSPGARPTATRPSLHPLAANGTRIDRTGSVTEGHDTTTPDQRTACVNTIENRGQRHTHSPNRESMCPYHRSNPANAPPPGSD